jgi:hypothetical protein
MANQRGARFLTTQTRAGPHFSHPFRPRARRWMASPLVGEKLRRRSDKRPYRSRPTSIPRLSAGTVQDGGPLSGPRSVFHTH